MTSGELVTFLAFVAGTAAVWATAFVAWPAAARAQFEYEMLVLHDDLEDATFDGVLPAEHPYVERLLNLTSFYVENARHFTAATALIVHIAGKRSGWQVVRHQVTKDGLSPDELAYVARIDKRFAAAARRYLLIGTVTGWVAAVVLRRRKRGGAHAVHHKPFDLEPPPTQLLITEYEIAARRERTLTAA